MSNEPLTPAPGVLDEQAGYACIRNLEPPHPGEPGGGGGLGIVVGDCVSARPSSTGDGEQDIDETRCDGTGTHPPTHQVTSIGTGGLFPTECPPGTDLRFTIASTFSALPTDKLACAAPVASPTG